MLNLNECTKTKSKPKLTPIFKNCSYVCAYHWAQLSYTTQHRTVLIIFLHILQTIIIAQMMSTRAEGMKKDEVLWFHCLAHTHTHTHTQPFYGPFPGPPGSAGARRELLNFMVQGKINRGRHTDHPAGRHSIRTNQCLPPPSPIFFTGWMAFLPANQQHQSTEATSAFG